MALMLERKRAELRSVMADLNEHSRKAEVREMKFEQEVNTFLRYLSI